jgi:hypothetical protein
MLLYLLASTVSCLCCRHALQASTALYLPDALDAWESFAGTGSGKGARLYQGPYALAAIRPRPIMLDSAAGACCCGLPEAPCTGHRTLCHKLSPCNMLCVRITTLSQRCWSQAELAGTFAASVGREPLSRQRCCCCGAGAVAHTCCATHSLHLIATLMLKPPSHCSVLLLQARSTTRTSATVSSGARQQHPQQQPRAPLHASLEVGEEPPAEVALQHNASCATMRIGMLCIVVACNCSRLPFVRPVAGDLTVAGCHSSAHRLQRLTV